MLFTAERDVCVMEIFKKSGGARAPPGPSDATPMYDKSITVIALTLIRPIGVKMTPRSVLCIYNFDETLDSGPIS